MSSAKMAAILSRGRWVKDNAGFTCHIPDVAYNEPIDIRHMEFIIDNDGLVYGYLLIEVLQYWWQTELFYCSV